MLYDFFNIIEYKHAVQTEKSSQEGFILGCG
jgi:hypothetical protein